MRLKKPLSEDVLTNLFRTSSQDSLRIVNREGSTIEFKESYSHAGMAQYFKTMAAYANNSGGYIIFGVGDKPRRLIGLKEKNLEQFENLKVEEFTKNLLDYFSPEIKWEHCTFEFKEMSFGVIYTEPLKKKPCICKKAYDDKNAKYTLKEGDIFYRYGGRSEHIRFDELSEIIDSARKWEEQQWLEFMKRAVKIGIENACLLDLDTGKITGDGGTVIIDNDLMKKISFIKEGEFVETKGKPTLRLIGDIKEVNTGKIIVKETTQKIEKAIEPNDIVKAFLQRKDVDTPMEYVKMICSATTANYPIYYFIKKTDATIDNAIRIIEETTARGAAKRALLERIKGKRIQKVKLSSSYNVSSMKKVEYSAAWESENVILDASEIGFCIDALLTLEDNVIKKHEEYIRKKLLIVFEQYYENAKPTIASNIRKAICRIDEVLYADECIENK